MSADGNLEVQIVLKTNKALEKELQEVENRAVQSGRTIGKGLTDGANSAESAFERFSRAVERNQQTLRNVGLAAAALGASLTAAIGGGVLQFVRFEDSIARAVGAAGGGAADMKLFSDAAKGMARELGAGGVTAKSAADALFSIASAGLKGADAINVLRPSLQLAAATQSNMEQTTEAVIATLAQFGLSTSEAARVTNVFGAVNTLSLGRVSGFMEAMKQAGPAATMMGHSIEETSAALAVLFTSGLKAEQAGVGLRNILLLLLDPSTEARDALKGVGISMGDINPRAKSLADIVDLFREKQVDATIVAKLFGKENTVAFANLTKAGGAALTEMQAKLTGTNAVMEQYAVQANTAGGAIRDLRSQVELLTLDLGDRFANAIRPAVTGLKNMVVAADSAPAPLKDLAAAVMIGTTAFAN